MMAHLPSPITDKAFRSERLIYRAIEPDADAPLRKRLVDNPRMASAIRLEVLTPVNLQSIVSTMIRPQDLVGLTVCLPSEEDENVAGQAIGFAKLMGPSTGIPHRTASFAIYLDEASQGKGYGAEAVTFLCKVGFEYAGLHRIEAKYNALNEAAARCYKQVGFKIEGTDREALWYNSGWVDIVRIGMLDHEWRALSNGQQLEQARLGTAKSA